MPPKRSTTPSTERKPGSLVGVAEISERLGVSRQRAAQLAEREDFPAPEVNLRSGPVWRASVVDRWIAEHRPRGTAGADPP